MSKVHIILNYPLSHEYLENKKSKSHHDYAILNCSVFSGHKQTNNVCSPFYDDLVPYCDHMSVQCSDHLIGIGTSTVHVYFVASTGQMQIVYYLNTILLMNCYLIEKIYLLFSYAQLTLTLVLTFKWILLYKN